MHGPENDRVDGSCGASFFPLLPGVEACSVAGVQFAERAFNTGEVIINFADGPSNGPPLVVLHGGAGRWQYSQVFLELLTPNWHVFAPDLRGHGKSGRVPRVYQLVDYVRDTAAFLSSVVADPAIVYGHSLGGEVAIKTASVHARLFRALIVGDAPLSTCNLAAEEPAHRAHNVLCHRLAGRAVAEIVPALKEMLERGAPGCAPRCARVVMGEDHT